MPDSLCRFAECVNCGMPASDHFGLKCPFAPSSLELGGLVHQLRLWLTLRLEEEWRSPRIDLDRFPDAESWISWRLRSDDGPDAGDVFEGAYYPDEEDPPPGDTCSSDRRTALWAS